MKLPLVSPGEQFGRWDVIQRAPTRRTLSGSYLVYWYCRCACGTEAEVQQRHLTGGRSSSCGCWKRAAAAKQETTHGGRSTALYDVWTQMLQRCRNPENKSYPSYGGRGIEVAPEWHDFVTFQKWAQSNEYAPGLTIDREENDQGYRPGNCRWVSNKINSRNRSKVLMVVWEGLNVALNDVAERHGLKLNTVYSRFKLKGWTLRQALGIDNAPATVRHPISEETRQRMQCAALRREEQKRAPPT